MNKRVKIVAGNGILLALCVVFTIISNYIQIGGISINLSMIPIVISGILYGPISALLLGIVNGCLVMAAPSTSAFFAASIAGTILTCLLKSAFAGLLSALVYKLLNKHNDLMAMIVASLIAPIINTTIFILFSLIFFKSTFGQLISLFVSINFIIEFVSTIVVSPSVLKVVMKKGNTQNKVGQ